MTFRIPENWRELDREVARRVACAGGCGAPIAGVDARGRVRRYRIGHAGRNCWTRRDDDRLLTLYERGATDVELARALGRTQAAVVARRGKILARLGRGDQLTTRDVARLFGVTNACVRNWIRRGWLAARRSGWLRRGRHGDATYRAWWSSAADVAAFMAREELWARWWPEDMPAGHWRLVALDLRGDRRFLTTAEVGARLGYTATHVAHLIETGRLRGVLGCARFPSGRSRAWYVRSDWMPRSAAEIAP